MNGNFVYTIAGDIAPSMLASLNEFLCEPFPGDAVLVPASGWTWAQLRCVPIGDPSSGLLHNNDTLFTALVANPCFADVALPVTPGWLGNLDNFTYDTVTVSFAYVEKDKATTKCAIREGVCMFSHQVQFIHCGDSPTVKQCSRCHSLGHFTGKCKLPQGVIKCACCGGDHEMKNHDFSCPRPHKIPLGCDCPLVCLLCKQQGHHARSCQCPARQDYVAAISAGSLPAHPSAPSNPSPPVAPKSKPAPRPSESANRTAPVARCDDDGIMDSLGPTLAPGPLSAAPPLLGPTRSLSQSVLDGLARTQALLEEARKEGLMDDAGILSLSETVRASVPGLSQLPLSCPCLSDLTDSAIEMALDERSLSCFSVDHTRDLILACGDLANVADYNRYLQLKDIQRSRFEKAMAEDDDQAMWDAAYGPPPTAPLSALCHSLRLFMHTTSLASIPRDLTPL